MFMYPILKYFKYVWKHEVENTCLEKLSCDDSMSKLRISNECTFNAESSYDIDSCVTELSSIIHKVASPDCKYRCNNTTSYIHDSSKEWFNDECSSKREQLNIYRDEVKNENRLNMIAARYV